MSTDPSISTEQHHKRRNRTILAFFVSSLTSRGVGIGCQMLQVPLALALLGNEAFGFWITLNSIGYLLTFTDFGIGLGAQNQIAEATGRGDDLQARRIFFTGTIFLCVISLLLMVLSPLSLLINWQHALHLTDLNLVHNTRPVILAVILFWCLGIPLGMAQRVAYGVQLGWLCNVLDAVRNVILLAMVYVEVKMRSDFAFFIISTAAAGFAVQVFFFVYLLYRLGWLQMRLSWFERGLLGRLTNVGVFFFLQQIASLVLFSASPLILSTTLGVAAVTPYNLAQRVFSPLLLIANAYLLPIWPAYAEAKARGDWAWIHRMLRRSMFVVIALCVLPMAVATCYMQPIIRLWTGGKAELPTQGLLWLLFAWNALTVLQQPFGYLLAGLSEVRRSTLYSVLTTILALAIMFPLIPRFGVNALPLGLIIGFLPFIFCGNAVETWIVLRREGRQKKQAEAEAATALTSTGNVV
jgi:O-antigen/teichoic acid export membrane protein